MTDLKKLLAWRTNFKSDSVIDDIKKLDALIFDIVVGYELANRPWPTIKIVGVNGDDGYVDVDGDVIRIHIPQWVVDKAIANLDVTTKVPLDLQQLRAKQKDKWDSLSIIDKVASIWGVFDGIGR